MNGCTWWQAALITKYDKMNHARVGLKFHEWDWNVQSFILKGTLTLRFAITLDYDIWIVHEFDIGSQDARFEIIVGHVVASTHAAQCNMD